MTVVSPVSCQEQVSQVKSTLRFYQIFSCRSISVFENFVLETFFKFPNGLGGLKIRKLMCLILIFHEISADI